jgi:hypothetical protein
VSTLGQHRAEASRLIRIPKSGTDCDPDSDPDIQGNSGWTMQFRTTRRYSRATGSERTARDTRLIREPARTTAAAPTTL